MMMTSKEKELEEKMKEYGVHHQSPRDEKEAEKIKQEKGEQGRKS